MRAATAHYAKGQRSDLLCQPGRISHLGWRQRTRSSRILRYWLGFDLNDQLCLWVGHILCHAAGSRAGGSGHTKPGHPTGRLATPSLIRSYLHNLVVSNPDPVNLQTGVLGNPYPDVTSYLLYLPLLPWDGNSARQAIGFIQVEDMVQSGYTRTQSFSSYVLRIMACHPLDFPKNHYCQ